MLVADIWPKGFQEAFVALVKESVKDDLARENTLVSRSRKLGGVAAASFSAAALISSVRRFSNA
jgi:hypothetical protein